MATLYTSKILTPSVSSFHDIEGVPSIKNWINSQTPATDITPSVAYPFYYKTPFLSFIDTQYGFAPNSIFNFFAYGSEFLGTTACYEIFDEYKSSPVSYVCKQIPALSSASAPPLGSVIDIVSGKNVAAAWYITVSKHPIDLANLKVKSEIINGIGINSTAYDNNITLDMSNPVPEISFRTDYVDADDTLRLLLDYNPLLGSDARYNIVANRISMPNTPHFNASSIYVSGVSQSSLLFNIPLDTAQAGRFYTFINNSIDGALAETVFVKGNQLTQSTLFTKTPGFPSGINVFVTDSATLTCDIPVGTGSWDISGVFVQYDGDSSDTPKEKFNIETTSDITLIDGITAYNYDSIVKDAGTVAAKYDLNITSGDKNVVENRVLYLNWYKPQLNIVELVTTNTPASTTLLELSARQVRDNEFELFSIRKNNAHTWNISGYKTSINYIDVNQASQVVSYSNLISSSWVGELSSNTFNVGAITPLLIDKVYYWDDFDPENPSNPFSTTSKFNYGGKWDIIISIPGGDPIVKKTITATWSDPSLGLINYKTTNNLIAASSVSLYSIISSSLEAFAIYEPATVGAPISIILKNSIPLEAYICRALYSSSDIHLDNVTSLIPLTAEINNINTFVTEELADLGASYSVMVRNISDSTDTGIYNYQQIANNSVAGGVVLSDLTIGPSQPINISTSKTISSISFSISSTGDTYYIAGYKTPNDSTNLLPNVFTLTMNNSSLTLDTIPTNIGYDASWRILVQSYDHNYAKAVDASIIFNNAGVYNTSIKETTATGVGYDELSAVKIIPTYTPTTINLILSASQTAVDKLTAVQVFGYRYGITNACTDEEILPLLPSIVEAEIQHTFTYPGTYTVTVTAFSGTEIRTTLNKKHYFKIIEIPPLVNFDITNIAPSLSNYTAKQGTSATELSYYVAKNEYTKIAAYDIYVNTWSTAPGSFPINSIWIDYGDGSQVEKINRNRDTIQDYSELAFPDSSQDPRNYVFKHTYIIPDYNTYSKTISITAFSQNTNTYSIGSKTITNINASPAVKKYLLNNSILDDGTVIYNMQIDQSTINQMSSSASISPISYPDPRYYNILV